MKTSLLLLGLVMGAGLAGTAHAADVTTHAHALDAGDAMLVAASTSDDGVLSALGDLLSGKSHRPADRSHDDCDSHAQANDGAKNHLPPGPMTPAPMASQHPQQPARARPAPALPGATTHGGGEPPADHPPSLGWQSLLPGSIQ